MFSICLSGVVSKSWDCVVKSSCRQINPFPNKPWFLRVCSIGLLEKTVGKGEIAHGEQFLLFPQCFLLVWRTFLPFSSNMKLTSANSFSLEKSKICRLGKGELYPMTTLSVSKELILCGTISGFMTLEKEKNVGS